MTTGLRLSTDIAKKGKRPRLPKPQYLALNRNVQNAKSGLCAGRERHGLREDSVIFLRYVLHQMRFFAVSLQLVRESSELSFHFLSLFDGSTITMYVLFADSRFPFTYAFDYFSQIVLKLLVSDVT